MNVFSSLTLWIILATIIPGLITIACIFIIINWVFPNIYEEYCQLSNWYELSLAVAIMIITQTLGIIQEKIFDVLKMFPKKTEGINDYGILNDLSLDKNKIEAKKEYKYLYFLMSILQKEDDKHGHIQRIVGQFYLTLNNLVSYFIGLVVMFLLLFVESYNNRVLIFAIVMIVLYLLTFIAMRIRYKRLVKTIWITRQIVTKRLQKNLINKAHNNA